MEANREKEAESSPNEFSLINIVIVWMEKTISRELQDNVLAMFICKANPRRFIMKFLLMLIYWNSHFIDFRNSWLKRFFDCEY